MSLQAIFAAIAPRLPKGLRFVGPDRGADNSAPPSITWEPTGAAHVAPRGTRDILWRQWTISVEVWGENLEAAETMTNAFLAAAHDILSANGYRPGTELWLTGGATAKGAVCKLTFNLVTPIPKTEFPTVPVDTLQANFKVGQTEVPVTITSE